MLHASSLLWSDVGLDGIVRGGSCMVCGTSLATSRGEERADTHRKSKPRREDRGPGSSRRAGGHGGVDSSAGPVQTGSPDGARDDGSVTPVPDRAGGGHKATRRTVESIAIASIQTSAGVPRPGPPAVHTSTQSSPQCAILQRVPRKPYRQACAPISTHAPLLCFSPSS